MADQISFKTPYTIGGDIYLGKPPGTANLLIN
jgi:hypothetical protein